MSRRLGYAIWVAMGVVLPRTGLTESRDADVLICSDDVRAAGPLPELLDNDIQALGYEAEVDEGCDIDTDAAAKETIIARDAQALVRIDTRQQTARIWVWDRGNGQSVTRSLPLLDDTVEDNASETSLGISELLRAIFVELETLPKSMTQGFSAVSPADAPPVALSSPVEPAKTARNAAETVAPIDVPEQTPNAESSLEAVSVDSMPAKPLTSPPPRRPWRLDIRTAVTALTGVTELTLFCKGVFEMKRQRSVWLLLVASFVFVACPVIDVPAIGDGDDSTDTKGDDPGPECSENSENGVCDPGNEPVCPEGMEPQAEECNGVDDDCDGEIDEGLENCGGEELCPDGTIPEDEVCNGFDDDCDGLIDEDC